MPSYVHSNVNKLTGLTFSIKPRGYDECRQNKIVKEHSLYFSQRVIDLLLEYGQRENKQNT